MGTPYYHTDKSAVEVVRHYRNDNCHDSYHDALVSMSENIDDLDDEDKSAYNHIMRNNALHHRLITTAKKRVTSWTVNLYWDDGSVEERTDAPDAEYINQWINELEEEKDGEL